MLIQRWPDVNIPNNRRETPLHFLINQDLKKRKSINDINNNNSLSLFNRKNQNSNNNRNQPKIHYTSTVAKKLLEKGANMRCIDNMERSIIHSLCEQGMPRILEIVLERDDGLKNIREGKNGMTPLIYIAHLLKEITNHERK